MLGYKYKRIMKSLPQKKNMKLTRKVFIIELLRKNFDLNEYLIFFDISGFNSSNFQKKCWAKKGSKFTSKEKYSYDKIHLLLLMDKNSLISFKFIRRKIRTLEILFFFDESLKFILEKSKERQITLIIENDPKHKKDIIINFFILKNINVQFTPKCHPLFNPCEYFFRYVKKDLKRKYFWNRYYKKRGNNKYCI